LKALNLIKLLENAVTLNPAGKVGLDEQLVTAPPLLVKISVVIGRP
jgi:hypothetical protein